MDVESENTKIGNKSSKPSNDSIKHLTEFLDDRKELHTLLFNIISKKEVKEMMPDILKVLRDTCITIISQGQWCFLCRVLCAALIATPPEWTAGS